MDKNNEKKIKDRNKASLTLRIVAGLYLLYIDYSLLTDWNEVPEQNRTFITIAIIVFAIAGILLTVISFINLLQLRKKEKR